MQAVSEVCFWKSALAVIFAYVWNSSLAGIRFKIAYNNLNCIGLVYLALTGTISFAVCVVVNCSNLCILNFTIDVYRPSL